MKTTVIMPAYNAEKTLGKTIEDIPLDCVNEIILVDDDSRDATVETAKEFARNHPRLVLVDKDDLTYKGTGIPFVVYARPRNGGYGANQKDCYDLALARGADIVIMVHPDYQYDPTVIKYFVEFIGDGQFDMMLGSRIRSRAESLASGMPAYKYFFNRFLTLIENIASGLTLSEWHSGMRAYSREVLEKMDYQKFSNDFIFDTQALFKTVRNDFKIGELPVPVRYFKEASSINLKRSVRYGLLTLWETFRFTVLRTIDKREKYEQFLIYLLAGLTGFLSNMVIYRTLLHFFGEEDYLHWAVIAFVSGGIVGFVLQKYMVFKNKTTQNFLRQVALYIGFMLLNLGLNTLILYFLVDHFHFAEFSAGVISAAFVSLLSFFAYKYIVFKV